MKTLSTGQIAKYCDVNLRTVIRWIDNGELKGFKLPGRGNNRVQVDDFIEFLVRYGMPIPAELSGMVNRKILIVDDEEAITRSIQRTLRPEGYQTLVAHDGMQAGVLLMQERPALMTLDLSMPGLDGLSVLEFVRSRPALSGLKILVITALGKAAQEGAVTMGADHAISKPFDPSDLKYQIGRLLGYE